MKPTPPPGFTTTQGRPGPTHIRKEPWPPWHPRTKESTACPLPQARSFPNDQWEHTPSHAGGHAGCAVRMRPRKARRHIREPSFVTHRQRTASVAGDMHSHNLPQQALAYPPSTAYAAGRWTGRSGACRFGVLRGAKHRAAGIARRAFPWRKAKRAAPQARRCVRDQAAWP